MENRENIGWDEVLEGGLAPYSELAAPEEDWLGSLNEAQREAVTTTEGYVRVIAGAGTGKTRALAYRFAYLANVLGILPGHILCATFTNKAAGEMRRRIRRLIGDADTGLINTFHGLRVAVLQADGHALQLPKSFSVLDNGDIDAMLAIVYEERGLTLRERTYAQARDKIEMLKTRDRTDYFHDFIAMGDDELKRRYAEAETVDDIIFYGHLLQQKKSFGLDYNDLIILTLHLFDTCPEVRRAWQERMEYVMVDEFQDIDGLQYALMEALAGHHGNLFVVGDPDQTIYTWRGANVRYLTEFDAHFHGTRTIIMLENYRSVPQVLSAANSLIARNRQRIAKDLLARRTDAGPAVWYHGADSPPRPPGSPRECGHCTAPGWPMATSRCSTGPITPRGPWRKPSSASRSPTRCTRAHRSSPDARSRTRCRTCASSRRKTTWISAAWPTCPSAIWGAGA